MEMISGAPVGTGIKSWMAEMKIFGFRAKLAEGQKRLDIMLEYDHRTKEQGSNRGVVQDICRKHGITDATLYLYRQRVKGLNKSDWLWALFPDWARTGWVRVEIPVAAWDVFIAARQNPPGLPVSKCYGIVRRLAATRGWIVPSYRTFLRRLDEFLQVKKTGSRE